MSLTSIKRNWINGNRKDAVDEIASRSHADIFAFVLWLNRQSGDYAKSDIATFATLMDIHRDGHSKADSVAPPDEIKAFFREIRVESHDGKLLYIALPTFIHDDSLMRSVGTTDHKSSNGSEWVARRSQTRKHTTGFLAGGYTVFYNRVK